MTQPRLGRLHLRFLAVILVVAAVVAVFGIRLLDLQVVQASTLNAQAKDKRSVPVALEATRGSIVDRNGTVLAETVMRYRLTTDQTLVGDFERTTATSTKLVTVATAAHEIAKATGEFPADILHRLTGTKRYSIVAEQLDAGAYQAVRALDIPWIFTEVTQKRYYPNGAVAGNLVGFVGSDNTPLAGVELMENKCLAGTNGEEEYEKSLNGTRIPGTTVTTKPVENGQTVKLTIDSDVQWYAQQKLAEAVKTLKAKWATAVLIDATTGDLVAVADAPSVDPNNVAASAASDRGSRAFSTPIEPGSTMKSITAAAVMDSGKATATTRVVAPGRRSIGSGLSFGDAEAHGNWRLTLTGVLQESSNTGISYIGEKISDKTRFGYIDQFGFGHRTAVGFTGESSGLVNDYSKMDILSHYTTMFGQAIATTPVQMADAYQAIANHGERISPRLVASCTSTAGKVTENPRAKAVNVTKRATADELVKMLESVTAPTSFGHAGQVWGYRVAAKTGTAQIAGPNGSYVKDHFATSFIGIAPAEKPRFVLAITVYDPLTNRQSTAPAQIFPDIMTQALKAFDVPPSTGSRPKIPTTW